MERENFEYYKTKRYTCLKYSQKQTEEIYMTFCGVEHCVSGKGFGPAAREDYHLHVILSGKGTLTVHGETYHLHGSQVFLEKPGEEIHYQADELDPWYYCWVSFNGTAAKRYMDAAGFTDGINVQNCYVDAQELLMLSQRLLECTELTLINELRRLGLMLEFISLVIESFTKGAQVIRHHHDYSPDVYVNHALDFIRFNYASIKVNDIAKYIGINRSYLTNIFKKKIGVSPQEYLLQYRLNMGCQLLLTTNLSIQEVAQKIGYENPLTFSKMFKNAYGISPRNYRMRGHLDLAESKQESEIEEAEKAEEKDHMTTGGKPL